ncbi:hypothetical protein [Xanthomonas fragariae]|uniref:hypothetical protein n=1 Tax=Xanthomonas fragariae TaxID=48664 RepID=UPI001ABE3DBB|nr:hypothetical protein [Xanthomonas fragariae]UKR54277.1 hypothetical protein K4A87_17305 [Xanthomonas fragariae]WAT16669.1 hypothetical protein OZ429_17010 [Xanthomonas fragariae]
MAAGTAAVLANRAPADAFIARDSIIDADGTDFRHPGHDGGVLRQQQRAAW